MKNDGIINETFEEDTGVTKIDIVESPKTLFRFRTCSDYNLDAFLKDEVWLSKPTTFNDPYDFTFVVTKKDIKDKFSDYILNFIGEDEILIERKNRDLTRKEFFNDMLKNFIINQEKMYKNLAVIGCFSSRIDNEIMWGHYSDSSKGYVIEYDFNDLRRNTDELLCFLYDVESNGLEEFFKAMNIDKIFMKNDYKLAKEKYGVFPVRYRNGKYNFSNYLNNIFMNFEKGKKTFNDIIDIGKQEYNPFANKIMIQSIALHKKKVWNYEFEWRIVLPNLFYDSLFREKDFVFGFKCKPIAIYLGENISKINEKLLISIAKEKGIKIYQMETDYFRKRELLKHFELNQ